jgi:succinyl-diaminopimelate desuccinylase
MTDALSIAQQLVRCPSVTPADAGALGVLESILKAAGFEVHRVTFGEPGTSDIDNLYARIGNSAPHLTFAGHTDVVPPAVSPRCYNILPITAASRAKTAKARSRS